MIAALLWIDAAAFAGLLSAATGGSDFSVFIGLIVGGGVYWALAGRNIVAEVTETSRDRTMSRPTPF